MSSTTATFVQLKLSLLRGGLRQSAGRAAAHLISASLGLLAAAAGAFGLALLRGNAHAPDVAILLFTLIALGWSVVPLFFFGGDETLDPTRLTMLPLRPRPLVAGLLAASLVGFGPLATLVLAGGGVLSMAHGVAGAVAAVPAALLIVLLCVCLTRALAAANTRLLTSRKGRDLAVLSGLFTAIGSQALNLGLRSLGGPEGLRELRPFAAVLRWLPPGMAADAVRSASEGSYLLATAELAVVAVAVLGLLRWWHGSLRRLMVSPDSSTLRSSVPKERARAEGDAWALLPEGRTGAVVQRLFRYAWREPRAKTAWATAIGVGVLIPAVTTLQGGGSAYQACWVTALLGLQMYNQFGMDGSAFWSVAATISTREDARAELRARNLAVALIAVPFAVVVTSGLALATGRLPRLPEALGLSLALLGALMATGSLTSVLLPYSVPRDNPMSQAAPGQGALAWMGMVGGAAVGTLLCAPLLAGTVLLHVLGGHAWLWTVLPLGAGYGFLLARLGIDLAAKPLLARLPEILQAVSKG